MSLTLASWNKNGQATAIAINLSEVIGAACVNHLCQPKYALWHSGEIQLPESMKLI